MPRALVGMCASRFPGGTPAFDAVPAWMAGVVRRGTTRHQLPLLPGTP